jgi:hypothetical protein
VLEDVEKHYRDTKGCQIMLRTRGMLNNIKDYYYYYWVIRALEKMIGALGHSVEGIPRNV